MVTESDGRVEPFVAVPALARAARELGAAVIEACAVRTLDMEAGHIAGVVTEKGRVRCSKVVLSGGIWSTHFAANAGINLLAVRSTAARTEPVPEYYSPNLVLGGLGTHDGLAARRRTDGGYTVSKGDLAEHYISPGSFKYFTKSLKLMKIYADFFSLHFAAPKGYPGAWSTPRRWSSDEVSPFERMRGQSRTFTDRGTTGQRANAEMVARSKRSPSWPRLGPERLTSRPMQCQR